MSDQPWIPLYVNDFLTDTLDLKADEIGIYMLLLMLSWKRGGSLPNDMKVLKSMLSRSATDMHGNRFNRIVPKLLERYFFIDEDGDLYNKRLRNELETARKRSGKQSEKAKKRWADENNNNYLRNAAAMPKTCLSQSQSYRKKEDSLNEKKGAEILERTMRVFKTDPRYEFLKARWEKDRGELPDKYSVNWPFPISWITSEATPAPDMRRTA